MPQRDFEKNDKSSKCNGFKGHQQGQICNGTISLHKCHEKYILQENFMLFQKVHNFHIIGASLEPFYQTSVM